MTDDRISRLKQYSRQEEEPKEDQEDDCGAFGWLHGIRDKALMLELRLKTGNSVALGYAWMEKAEYDPSTGITLHVAGQKITLQGTKLNQPVRDNIKLFEGLLRHRVTWVREAEKSAVMSDATSPSLVERISIE